MAYEYKVLGTVSTEKCSVNISYADADNNDGGKSYWNWLSSVWDFIFSSWHGNLCYRNKT